MVMIKLDGHRTWASVAKAKAKGKGKRPTVVLLHGGMSSSASLLRDVAPRLEGRFRVAAFDRRGHGRTADTDEPFHYSTMADETIAFLEHLGVRTHLVGHSDGGVVALLVAMRRPDLVRRLVVIGANYHFSGLHDTPEFPLKGPIFKQWRRDYARLSPDGRGHARAVIQKATTLFASEPTLSCDDLATIKAPVLVMSGDDDVVKLSHTCSMYESFRNAQLAVVPGTSHGLLKERNKLCTRMIREFLTSELPPVTLAPVRRDRSR